MLLGEIVSEEPAVSSKPFAVVTPELPINTDAVLVERACITTPLVIAIDDDESCVAVTAEVV